MTKLPPLKATQSDGDTPNLDHLPQFATVRTSTSINSSGADDGSHLDELHVPDLDHGAPDLDAPVFLDEDGNLPAPAPEQIDRDAFYVVFETSFALPGQIVPDFAPLAIQEGEKQAARAASDAIYALLEIYYPRALMPGSETLAHLLVCGPFLVGKAMVVRGIIQARTALPSSPAPGPRRPASAGTPEGGDVVPFRTYELPGQQGFA